jgi:lysophospholipase L1-like esterase
MSNEISPIPTWRGRIIAILVGLFLLVVASEGILRIVMPNWREYHSARFMTVTSVPGYGGTSMGRPGFDGWFSQNNGDFRVHIHINDFGLRNDEPVAAADNRIWILGDSMSFGWGVERNESYGQILASRLGFPTYNIATPGSSVCGWQALYARMPKQLHPAAIVVGLTIENRVMILDCAANARDTPARGSFDIPSLSLGSIKYSMTQHFALYNFLAVSLKRVSLVEMILIKIGVINQPQGLTRVRDSAEVPKMIETTANEIRRLRAMTPTDRPFLVVLFPARFEIRDGNEHFRRVRSGVAAALSRDGISILDLLPEFKAAGFEATHFVHDGHWNANGHRIAGEAIARWFKAHPLTTPSRNANSQ